MKKQLSTAMAAAMAFGTVVPAFAAENTTQTNIVTEKVDVRTAKGMELVGKTTGGTVVTTIYNRQDVFNYNGYKPSERTKHTLKSDYKDMQVLFVKEDEKDANKDQIVLGKKIDAKDTAGTVQIATAKAKYDAMLAQMDLLEKNGYVKEVNKEETTDAKIVDGKYVAGVQTVELKPKNTTLGLNTYKFVFENIDSGLVTDTDVNAIRREVFGSLNIETTTGVTISTNKDKISVDFNKNAKDEVLNNVYAAANKLKFAVENNKEKFDIVVDETGIGNTGKEVRLYVKGAQKDDTKTLVMTLVFNNVKDINSSKIVDMPLLKDSDFKGHWAEKTIVDAMLSGYVDASTTFRPKDSVTRAEFAKMLCTVLNIEIKEGQEEPFHDVNTNAWYHKYIAALYNVKDLNGNVGAIVNGYADSTFKPNDAITRQEAAKMIAQAFLLQDKTEKKLLNSQNKVTVEKVNANGTVEFESLSLSDARVKGIEKVSKINTTLVNANSKTTFKDDAEIKDWADASVQALKDSGVINGYDDKTFKPNNSITRVEALLMITGDNRN